VIRNCVQNFKLKYFKKKKDEDIRFFRLIENIILNNKKKHLYNDNTPLSAIDLDFPSTPEI
jgi:hypothetical protein